MNKAPTLSIVLVVYSMPRQAMNTLYSLSVDFQENVSRDDYEIVIVENNSSKNLDASALQGINANITYILRNETSQSPARAINHGLRSTNGTIVGLMIDGARMVSPRVIEYALMASRTSRKFLAAVPSYNLGEMQQHFNISQNYTEETEKALLEKSRWKENGYRLFDIASLGDANPNGFMNPLLESNCFFAPKECFLAIGGAEEQFDLPGGGSLNLHTFRKIGMLPGIQYYLLCGEGTFHQFHGGITTSEYAEREAVLESHRRQLHSFWEGGFHSLRKEPILLGSINSQVMRYLKYSSRRTQARCKRREGNPELLWPDDQARN